MKLHFDGHTIEWFMGCVSGSMLADSVTRNELNERRPLGYAPQVVHAMTGNQYDKIPIMPRSFPVGTWDIWGIREKPPENTAMWPFFIATEAFQALPAWDLDILGGYLEPSSKMIVDYGYGIHYSSYMTTLGCIRVVHENELRALVKMLRKEIKKGNKSTIEVVYED